MRNMFRLAAFFAAILLFAAAPAPAATDPDTPAAKPAAKSPATSAAKARKAAPAKASPSKATTAKATAKPAKRAAKAPAVDPNNEIDAEKKFVAFQEEWTKNLNEFKGYGVERVKVEEDENAKGVYVASYRKLLGMRSAGIHKTDEKKCPFVGTLKYEEEVYTSRGKTPEEAKKGPFKYDYTHGFTEVFRYANGKWIF